MIDPDILITIIGILVAALAAVIAWIGTRIHDRLDEINTTLSNIERDLRYDLAKLDTRLSVVEAIVHK